MMNPEQPELKTYYVSHNGSAWFVKESNFFRSQRGHIELWGRAWQKIEAASIEDARTRAAKKYEKNGIVYKCGDCRKPIEKGCYCDAKCAGNA